MILRNIKQQEGIRVRGNNINNLRYAEDTVLIADSDEKLQNTRTTVTVESESKGLHLNAKKRLNAWLSQKGQAFLYVTFFAKGKE